MGHPHEVEDGESVVPVAGHGAAGAALPVAVDRVGLDPLNVPIGTLNDILDTLYSFNSFNLVGLLEMAESHGEEVHSVVDEGGLKVEAAGEFGEVQTAAHQQLLLHHPGHGGI